MNYNADNVITALSEDEGRENVLMSFASFALKRKFRKRFHIFYFGFLLNGL
jgi:hypothetical protein